MCAGRALDRTWSCAWTARAARTRGRTAARLTQLHENPFRPRPPPTAHESPGNAGCRTDTRAMNYSRFDHVDSDEEEPDTAAAAAGERRKLEAAADSIPGPLRMALGRMHIALDRGDEAAATDARNSMGVLINQLPESERPKVMAAIQSVVVGGAKVRPSGARLDASSRSVAKEEKAIQKPSPAVQKPTPAVQKPTPAVQALAPTVQALAPTVQKPAPVEDAGTSSREEARDELTRAASTLEAAQKELQALDPSDTVCAPVPTYAPWPHDLLTVHVPIAISLPTDARSVLDDSAACSTGCTRWASRRPTLRLRPSRTSRARRWSSSQKGSSRRGTRRSQSKR